jgi:hypothetical protein
MHIARAASLALLAGITAAPSALAQRCGTVASRTSLAAFGGERIARVDVVTLDAPPLPGPAAAMDDLHVRTRESTIRRQLLFDEGERVDTLAVAESMRRLRSLRYLSDAEVAGTGCSDGSGVAITVTTRDAWSTKADVRLGSRNATLVGLTERNVLGTGREASVHVRSDGSRIGIGASLLDPWLLGTRVAAAVGTDAYRDGGEWYAVLGPRERSVLDPWSATVTLARSTRESRDASGDIFRRFGGSALVSRRLRLSEAAVVALLAGAEGERTALAAGAGSVLVGPDEVRREFAGADVGLARRSVIYDTLTWLLPGAAIVDVPLALEGEAVVAVGRELRTGETMTHLDAWSGRMWRSGARSLLVGDLWMSGYYGTRGVESATLRGSLTAYHAARRGLWTARFGAERLVAPDPDLRAMRLADPTLEALPDRARMAEAVTTLSLERSVNLVSASRSWMVGGAAFAAGSARWDPADEPESGLEGVYVGAVGVGFRLVPKKAGRATARLDLGFPLLRSAATRSGPFVSISITPGLDQGRQRDGRRER